METKNFKATELITSVEDLLSHKSVYVTRWKRISPVAFLRNWQAHRLYSWVKQGVFYSIEKKIKW
jgi:hypothetical protein